ncbi:MAG: hypothetical protein QXY95_03240 [Thermosphaera sp.]
MLRLLEGEVLAYKGVGWVVKGYQHPSGHVVAYPRYDLINGRKLHQWELQRLSMNILSWECIKRDVPVIPVKESLKLSRGFNSRIGVIIDSLSRLLDKDEEEIELSGSSLLNDGYRDVDIILYQSEVETASLLEILIEKDVLKKINNYFLIREYVEKHSSRMSLENYLKLKRNTILHFMLGDSHVNVKLISFSSGFNDCYDKVENLSSYNGSFRVLKRLTAPLIPSRYLIEIQGEELEMETLREVYSELTPGDYYIAGGVIEDRRNKRVLVPDHGVILSK